MVAKKTITEPAGTKALIPIEKENKFYKSILNGREEVFKGKWEEGGVWAGKCVGLITASHVPGTWNPCIDHVPLVELGQKAWLEFKELDAAAGITAHAGIVYPIDKKTITPVKKECPFFNFIGDFPLQAFNKSYQMCVNKSSNENIIECKFDDGAITLETFVLTDRKPSGQEGVKFSQKSTYETIKDRWSDPEVDYEVCGMVRRRTKGGGL
ncbi:hypothetical protein Tco_1041907 [Tanacetum coccineum]|uniref:Uncharacterized protein n=1 Tax=Tanacetum coccineum TaxID=301880 RepID=A0ABQ5GHG4_9ASTR